MTLAWPSFSPMGVYTMSWGDHFLFLRNMNQEAKRKFDCYFPYFFEIRTRFPFVENRILLQRENGRIKGVEHGMSTKIQGKGKEEKKGDTKRLP